MLERIFHIMLCIVVHVFAGKLRFLHKRYNQPESSATKSIMFCCGPEENLQSNGEWLLHTLHSVGHVQSSLSCSFETKEAWEAPQGLEGEEHWWSETVRFEINQPAEWPLPQTQRLTPCTWFKNAAQPRAQILQTTDTVQTLPLVSECHTRSGRGRYFLYGHNTGRTIVSGAQRQVKFNWTAQPQIRCLKGLCSVATVALH